MQWLIVGAAGEPVGVSTPVSWAIAIARLALLGTRRLESLEL